eukprot:UN01111
MDLDSLLELNTSWFLNVNFFNTMTCFIKANTASLQPQGGHLTFPKISKIISKIQGVSFSYSLER